MAKVVLTREKRNVRAGSRLSTHRPYALSGAKRRASLPKSLAAKSSVSASSKLIETKEFKRDYNLDSRDGFC